MIILGDFNAKKTGSGYRDYPDTMGKYGKGKLNGSGKCLLDYAKENELDLTNTTFKHKIGRHGPAPKETEMTITTTAPSVEIRIEIR